MKSFLTKSRTIKYSFTLPFSTFNRLNTKDQDKGKGKMPANYVPEESLPKSNDIIQIALLIHIKRI